MSTYIEGHRVTLEDGNTVHYNKLVIATGSQYGSYGIFRVYAAIGVASKLWAQAPSPQERKFRSFISCLYVVTTRLNLTCGY